MNYWMINPKFEGGKTDLSEEHNDRVYMGWSSSKCPTFYNDVRQGDVIIVASGSHKKSKLHFVGLADNLEDQCWILKYPTKEMNNEIARIIRQNPSALGGRESNNPWGPSKSIIRLGNNSAEQQIKQILKQYFSNAKMNERIQKYKTLLEKTHNLILTGAPGTGKTYLAKEIAKTRGAKVCFVQFHPSYDYTDFVEGLRPIQDDNGSVGFERKDGVFKAFCEKAIEKYENNNFEEAWTAFLNEVRETGNLMELKTPAGAIFYVSVNQRKNLTFYTGTDKKVGGPLTRKGVKTEFEGNPYYKYWLGYYNGVIDYMKSRHNLHSVEYTNKNFVFIIDEINRGDYSKIFGELFYSIDPGYRVNVSNIAADKPIAIRTQYANMETEPNGFDSALGITDSNDFGHFFVPENVYIIGTMNDIDRSVESMDFAFRRRFAFVEIKTEDEISTSMLDSLEWKEEAIKHMKRLNTAIENVDGLNSAYHIGASYFLKLKDYNGDFQKLWEYHLEGLLREYLRGMQNVDEKIKKLYEAYNEGKEKLLSTDPTNDNSTSNKG